MKNHVHSQNLLVHFLRGEEIKACSLAYQSLVLNNRQLCELELLLSRAFYPLNGYLGREDYESVLSSMRLADGTLWPMPVSLDVPESLAQKIAPGDKLALRDVEGFMLAVLTVGDVWQADNLQEARAIFGVESPEAHPDAMEYVRSRTEYRLAGTLEGLALPSHCDYAEARRSPAAVQHFFQQRGWRKILGHQSQGLLHCAHKAMLLEAARSVGGNILLQSVVDDALAGGIAHFATVRCAQRFAETFPANMLQLNLLPRFGVNAGPRQALFEALVHKNYGCTHYLVTPDHADPLAPTAESRFYPLGEAQRLVESLADETGIAMVPLTPMTYVEEKAQYIAARDVTADMTVKDINAHEFKRRLEYNLDIPEWYAFPTVVEELRKSFPPRNKQGFVIFMTGLSGAGKSTLAKLLYVKFMELRTRPVTLLDGDIVRRHLSSELTFSKAHRDLNIRRIGFVASEIAKNGGIAICAPIAPYAASRRYVREMVSLYGGFMEIYVAAPLEVCEQRDRKGLYAKARAGIIQGVTGVDDPYEIPEHPELALHTDRISPDEGAQEVLLYLEQQDYL
ncbi:bifunctional sulfate adenylyltransferase/adenylylsulfate kinase [Solidesulfovibrio alcoholivorans]|uniref:bifunctional sulfate adenylyltransferase/adenylylsulfate kinase n=1 Tax=Solidesulfovibrio alcoholivorans TaxID=81406 RepID=UPI000495F618|nr:bifunctional sulfate adenylyltransferase/adenylylsulfate kinase [Solidesulfovibrio alcoholivorans]